MGNSAAKCQRTSYSILATSRSGGSFRALVSNGRHCRWNPSYQCWTKACDIPEFMANSRRKTGDRTLEYASSDDSDLNVFCRLKVGFAGSNCFGSNIDAHTEPANALGSWEN